MVCGLWGNAHLDWQLEAGGDVLGGGRQVGPQVCLRVGGAGLGEAIGLPLEQALEAEGHPDAIEAQCLQGQAASSAVAACLSGGPCSRGSQALIQGKHSMQ